jgi:DNA-binding Xre family transcriptional regulator
MSETSAIIEALKRTLKTRGLTYKDLAKKVGLSEASVKRVFASKSFTLQRLEAICSAAGVSVGELVRMAGTFQDPSSHYLSLEQEELLASDHRLLACFYLLLNHHGSAEILGKMQLSERELRALYVKLDAAKLIELQPGLKARLRTGPVISWRADGPVYAAYEKMVKTELLQSEFQGELEAIHFRSAELSEASAKILMRKLDQLSRDFAELAALDAALPAGEKRSVALLMAFRPWVFSMFKSFSPALGRKEN